MLDIPVLISGGGPVGLMASLLLSQHGVRSLLVERHPSTAITPKARGINARTMELFRQCGAVQRNHSLSRPQAAAMNLLRQYIFPRTAFPENQHR